MLTERDHNLGPVIIALIARGDKKAAPEHRGSSSGTKTAAARSPGSSTVLLRDQVTPDMVAARLRPSPVPHDRPSGGRQPRADKADLRAAAHSPRDNPAHADSADPIEYAPR